VGTMSTLQPLQPWTAFFRLDETSTMRTYRDTDRFAVIGVETTGRLAEPVHKSSDVPALLVTVPLREIAERDFGLWVDGKAIPTGDIPAFHATVIDLAAQPAMWGDRGIHFAHFHLRRSVIDDAATDLGFSPVGDFRLSLGQADLVLAQIARCAMRFVGADTPPSPLALDDLELLLAVHVMQRYGTPVHVRTAASGGLAPRQHRAVTEMLRENLSGRIRLADLARSCGLSVSHFARSFKLSFGVTCHRWLTDRRLDHAKDLLAKTNAPLSEVSTLSGFGNQAQFTRTFRRFVGVTPGQWRRAH
jgi:AraC family transcriptional regulator